MNDIPKALRLPVEPLELALERYPTGGLLIADDFCGDAGHANTTVGQWLGVSADDLPLKEKLVSPLTDERLKVFRSRQACFGFALARQVGLDNLRTFAAKQGMANIEVLEPFREVGATDTTFGQGSLLGSGSDAIELKTFFQDLSRKLFAPKMERQEEPWTQTVAADRLLGYGNTAQRLVFYYNVPTVSLTPLWLGGAGWKPLFRRREKPSTRKP